VSAINQTRQEANGDETSGNAWTFSRDCGLGMTAFNGAIVPAPACKANEQNSEAQQAR